MDTTGDTPLIEFLVGNYYRNAVSTSIDPTNRLLTFAYTVIASDSNQTCIEIEENALDLGGGSIKRERIYLDTFFNHDALLKDGAIWLSRPQDYRQRRDDNFRASGDLGHRRIRRDLCVHLDI